VIAYDGLYNLVAGSRSAGEFRPATRWGETDLVLLRGAGLFQPLRHELVHRLLQPALPKAPPWLAEGMAQYFQWTQVSETSITAGSTPESVRLQRVLHGSPFFPPLRELLATPRSAFYGRRAYGLYSASFWLVSTLNSDAGYRKRFHQALSAMASGLPPDDAWQRAFPAAEMEALERDYLAARFRSDPVAHTFDWHPDPVRVSPPRPLDRAETHVLTARLFGRFRPILAREELDAAIERDAWNAEAFALRSLFETGVSPQRREDAERAVEMDPAAPLGWQALGLSLLPALREADAARLREAILHLESFTDSAESQCLGAVLLDATGDRKRALKLARSAVRISPGYFYAHAVLARVSGGLEAREARAKAWALAPDGIDPDALVMLLGAPAADDTSERR
jgi:tetratricopeptide (TPR) repeat protein